MWSTYADELYHPAWIVQIYWVKIWAHIGIYIIKHTTYISKNDRF